MEHRLDGRAAVAQGLAVGLGDGGLHFGVIRLELAAPFALHVVCGQKGLAAVGVVADVLAGVAVRVVGHPVENEGPGRYGLGL